jgi:uncharacterized protein YkwD
VAIGLGVSERTMAARYRRRSAGTAARALTVHERQRSRVASAAQARLTSRAARSECLSPSSSSRTPPAISRIRNAHGIGRVATVEQLDDAGRYDFDRMASNEANRDDIEHITCLWRRDLAGNDVGWKVAQESDRKNMMKG